MKWGKNGKTASNYFLLTIGDTHVRECIVTPSIFHSDKVLLVPFIEKKLHWFSDFIEWMISFCKFWDKNRLVPFYLLQTFPHTTAYKTTSDIGYWRSLD